VRYAQVLLLAVFAGAASAQSFEQLGFLRLNDTTPKSTRVVGTGEATDALEGSIGDASLNPAMLTSIKHTSFLVQVAQNSITYNQYNIDTNTVASEWLTSSNLTHLSVAFPLKTGVASVDYASEPELTGPAPLVNTFGSAAYVAHDCSSGCSFLLPMRSAGFERHEKRLGAAYGWEHGALSIGAGAELRQIQERSDVPRAVFANSTMPVDPATELLIRRIDDRAIIANVGVRWTATPRFALSAAYNGGGSYERTTSACNVTDPLWGSCASAADQIGASDVRMPDAFRAGLSIAATERLRLIGEAVRHNYSNLAVDDYSIFGEELTTTYRDVTEVHAGAEYRWPSFALRAGYWTDPSRYVNRFVAGGQTVHHYTAGAGFNVSHARIDVAYEDADVDLQRRALVSIAFGM